MTRLKGFKLYFSKALKMLRAPFPKKRKEKK